MSSEHDAGPDQGPDLRTVAVAGCKILLARVQGTLHATGATCPHAGADLAEGVLHEGTVICPWHKAAFDLATGACLAPPAVDHLPRFPVRVENGRVLITLPATASPAPASVPDWRCFVLIGAGAAGAAAAQTLRQSGFGGRLIMIGQEDQLPYDRTLLSKYALSGESGGEKSPLQSAYFYHRHHIERRRATVVGLNPATRCITLDDGATLHYDAALLATGGTPKPPSLENQALPGLFVLRTRADCDAILARARTARSCVVLGAGFIGMETAAALRERGLQVTVVAPQSAPFERQLGPDIGRALAALHQSRGIEFRLGREAKALQGTDAVQAVTLDDSSTLPADLVIAGLGVTPNTAMLPNDVLTGDGAVTVAATLRLHDGLFAAGDIAAFPLYGDGPATRVEHWRVAQQHGRIAALNMLGGTTRFSEVPYFWTIHFRKRLDYIGHAGHWDQVTIDGDTATPAFIAYYVSQGIVTAFAAIDRDRAAAAAIPLFNRRHDWTVAELRSELAPFT